MGHWWSLPKRHSDRFPMLILVDSGDSQRRGKVPTPCLPQALDRCVQARRHAACSRTWGWGVGAGAISSQGPSAYSATSGAPLNPTSQQPHFLPAGCRGGRRGGSQEQRNGAGSSGCTHELQGAWSKLSVNSSLLGSSPFNDRGNTPGRGWQVLREHGDVSTGSP